MATTIDVSWYPTAPHFGDAVTIVVTLTPTPPDGANVWIFVDGVSSGQLFADFNGQASANFNGLSAGSHTVEGAFATLPATPGDPSESDSTVWPVSLIILAVPVPEPQAASTQEWTLDPSQVGTQGLVLGDANARMQIGSNAFSGISNVDPFTGAAATDPFTGEPLSARDASISDRIRAVYSQPDAVPESTRYAILDFYGKPGIDLTGVSQSIQNSILDIYSQAPEAPLPGIGFDEFLSNAFSSPFRDLSSSLRSMVGGISTGIDAVAQDPQLQPNVLLRPVYGWLDVVGGAAEMVGGVGAAFGSAGFAAAPGIGLASLGLDRVIAGFRKMFGEDAQSLTQYLLTEGFGPRAAFVLDGLIPIALGGVAGLASELGGETGTVSRGIRGLTTEATEAEAAARIEVSSTAAAARVELSESAQFPAGTTNWSATRAEMGGPSNLTRLTALENDIEVGHGSDYTRIGNDPATMRVTEVRETWPNTHDLIVHSEAAERRFSPGFPTQERPYWDIIETHEAQIAEAVNMNPNLRPGQPIRVVACALNPEQAQQLSNLTAHPVYASPFVVGVGEGSGAKPIEQFIRYDFGAAKWSMFAEKQVWHLYLPE
jgi:hypothetical protein